MWQGYPCSNAVQPKSSVDEVRHVSFANHSPRIQSFHKTDFRFHSDILENGRGFQAQYNTLQLFTACGGNYSNESGILSSPSQPNPYPDLADCVYLISQPNGTYVKISFLSMDIDCQEVLTSGGLIADYVEVRDGSYEDSPLMARFCGNVSNVSDFMQTTQNHLRVR